VRENVPRMPRATFSQIVNRSMSEVLVRSLVTGLSAVILVVSLLIFGGETLRDFAFALLVGIVSGAYSSIFIASPVLTHWKARERVYVQRTERIAREFGGMVPAYAVATVGGEPVDAEPTEPKTRRRRRRSTLSEDQPDDVSPEEFDEMVRDIQEPAAEAAEPVAPAPRRRSSTPSSSSSTGAQPKPKKDKPKRPRNRRHGRNR
jgi:SecD/SecF fusion protein